MTPANSANSATRRALEAGEGILRLAPTWVPRVFLQPGRRLKLDPRDLYAFGAHRGGIDERWLASTTPAMNDNRTPDEGLSYVVSGNDRFTLKEGAEAEGPRIVGPSIWETYRRWPVLSKFFDNAGPIMHHLHQDDQQASMVGREGKPEAYYFPPQLNSDLGNFPLTFFGLEPGTTREDIRECLARWDAGDNGILDFSRAYRLKPGSGWLIPPRTLHAPGSLLTYEPQWGSDVLAMFESMVEGRPVPRSLLTQDVPEDKHQDLDFLVDLIDWSANLDPEFKKHHYLEPIPVSDSASEGYVDKWIVYGKIDARQKFSARELTLLPGARCVIHDAGASGAVVIQGHGRVGKLEVECPSLIRFGQMTQDEFFISHEAAIQGVAFENLSQNEPLVILRCFGPDVHHDMPEAGSHTR